MSKSISVTWNKEQIIAEQKVVAVIKSCITTQQFESASIYLDLFYRQFRDIAVYTRLWNFWKTSITLFYKNLQL
jgi:hypothetical protein